MVRSVFYNSFVFDALAAFKCSAKHVNGLIIGKHCGDHDLAVKLLVSPIDQEKSDSLYMLAQAMEVTNMLPGGLFIIGAFDMSPSSSPSLKQVLKTYYENMKTMDIFPYINSVDSSGMLSMLDLDMKGEVRSFKQLDVNNKFSACPAKWIFNDALAGIWKTVTCKLNVDKTFFYGSNKKSAIEDQMKCYHARIFNSIGEVNGKVVENNVKASFDPTKNETKICSNESLSSRSTKLPSGENLSCNLYLASTQVDEVSEIKMTKNTGKLRLFGSMNLLAYIPPDDTIEAALSAIKLDALQSFNQRWNLFNEENPDYFSKPKSEVAILPKRVVYRDNKLTWFDYSFVNGVEEESLARFQENLNMEVKAEFVDDTVELIYSSAVEDIHEDEIVAAAADDHSGTTQRRDLTMFMLAVGSLVYCVYSFFTDFTYQDKEVSPLEDQIFKAASYYKGLMVTAFLFVVSFYIYQWNYGDGQANKTNKEKKS